MIRVLLVVLLLLLIVLVATQIFRSAKQSKVDWTGVAFMGVFVFMAFWLRGLTGIG